MSTNVTEFIGDLDIGGFQEKLSATLTEVAIGVMRSEGESKGKVTVSAEVNNIIESINKNQLNQEAISSSDELLKMIASKLQQTMEIIRADSW